MDSFRRLKSSKKLIECYKMKKSTVFLLTCFRWNVNRLVELEEQIGKFKVSIGESIKKRERSPNISNEGKINNSILSFSKRKPKQIILAKDERSGQWSRS